MTTAASATGTGAGSTISAPLRRSKLATEAAGLRPVELHGLRHASASILARVADPGCVRGYLGHAKLSSTDRHVSARQRSEDLDVLNRAFAAGVDQSASVET